MAHMGVFSQVFGIWESKSCTEILLRCHGRSQLHLRNQNWRSTGGQSLKSTVLYLWVSFHRFFCIWESKSGTMILLRCHWKSQLPFGGHNQRSTGGQSFKSTVLDFWLSFHRFFCIWKSKSGTKILLRCHWRS